MKLYFKSWLLRFFPDNIDAFTFGHRVFVRADTISRKMQLHELCHVCQYRKHGIWKFLWIYFVRERRLEYRDKSFEVEAYSCLTPVDLEILYPDDVTFIRSAVRKVYGY